MWPCFPPKDKMKYINNAYVIGIPIRLVIPDSDLVLPAEHTILGASMHGSFGRSILWVSTPHKPSRSDKKQPSSITAKLHCVKWLDDSKLTGHYIDTIYNGPDVYHILIEY